MTDRAAFTDDEWELLQVTPATVAVAVAKAANSGFWGGFKEMRAVIESARLGERRYPKNRVIRALTDGQKDVDDGLDDRSLSPAALADLAVDRCARASQVLQRIPANEASEVRLWLLDVAQHVAEAAKEDGVRVSEPEADLIDRLGAALS